MAEIDVSRWSGGQFYRDRSMVPFKVERAELIRCVSALREVGVRIGGGATRLKAGDDGELHIYLHGGGWKRYRRATVLRVSGGVVTFGLPLSDEAILAIAGGD